jgi:exodeoxyribonuclease V alpha subunit
MDELSGTVERITFYNPDNGYTVLRLRPEGTGRQRFPGLSRDGLMTVIGGLPEVLPGEHLHLRGHWDNHPKHGRQFKAEFCEQTLPATIVGIESYLGSGMVKGIGPRLAERIVARFGEATFDVIESQAERLLDVPGIGTDRQNKIMRAWQEQKHVKEIMVFLHGHGVSTNLAVKIYKTYGDASLQTVRENPYQLERDIYGVGFKTVDRIAQALGLSQDHPARIEAGLVFTLNEMSNEGHAYSPKEMLVQRTAGLLDIEPELIGPGLERLAQDGRIRPELVSTLGEKTAMSGTGVAESRNPYGVPVIYLTPLFYAEKGVAERLKMLASSKPRVPPNNRPTNSDQNLSEEQQQAVTMALNNPVSILTGGPGTGKTTCLKALIATLETRHTSFALASPTGRAAKRLAEATGYTASTIHRLLEFSPAEAGFKRNDDHPLDVDFLVVDEASMLDLLLTNNLLKALRPGTHVLFVGDVDQLPSVGAGDVLRNMIGSGIVPVARLTAIFRQAAGSQIITNAHRINQGKPPVFSRGKGDFFLFSAEDADAAANWVVEVVSARIPQKFGLDPVADIQVLTPVYRGPAGVSVLNERLQEKLNPPSPGKPERRLYGTTFRTGDKVMQTQNNYDKDIFNGDIGFIRSIDLVEQTINVDFDGRRVRYDWSETDELDLAYAISVHKGQGSEFPAVVVPIVPQHYMMLQRNLLYTSVTRARRLCVLVGSPRAIGIAVHNNKVSRRFTALEWRLGLKK